MILIADSGSTKTAWRLLDEMGKIHQFQTEGLNPVHRDKNYLKQVIQDELIEGHEGLLSGIMNIYFYGAGCVPGEAQKRMEAVLGEVFPVASISVADDMLAVARGVCGHEPGIACILGTGANSCYFDGEQIAYKVPALGYILGDEGSGAWMGKTLLAAYLREDLPDKIHGYFMDRFGLDRAQIIEKVYNEGHAASFLAGFSKFIFHHKDEPYIQRMICEGFDEFFEKNIVKYRNYERLPVHFSGSVAYYYSTLLRQIAARKGIHVKNIVEGPIAGLALFHKTENE